MSEIPTPPIRHTDALTREAAVRRVAAGEAAADVAHSLGVSRQTVNRWRREGASAVVYQDAVTERAEAMRATVLEARGYLEAHALDAAKTAVRHLGARKPADALRASGTVLDRVGIPRVSRVETPPPPEDLSGLSDDELALYERLKQKVTPP